MTPRPLNSIAEPATSYIQSARNFAAVLAAGAAERDTTRRLPFAEMQQLRETGIQAVRVERALGGPDVSFAEFAEIMLNLSVGDPNVAQSMQPHFVMIEWLRLDGTPAQRRKYSDAVLNGAIIGNAYAERGTGIVGEINTRLTRDGSGYRLTGTKFYSTGSLFADFIYAPALLDDGEQAIAIFPATREGVQLIDDWDGMGQRTTASGTTRLEGVAIALDEVIELRGMRERRVYIGAAAQIAHAAIDVGIAKAALDDAIAFGAKARAVPESGARTAADDPYVIRTIGEMATIYHAAEAMLARAGRHLDSAANAQLGRLADAAMLDRLLAESSIAVAEAKATAEHASLRLGEMMYRVGGASMTGRAHNLDRHWRNARTHTTHDPVAYKYKAIGDFYLNRRFPRISTKI